MISERDIAEKFSVVWKLHFPLLSPHFIRVFNETQVRSINANSIPPIEDIRYDLISEAAFNMSERVISQGQSITEAIEDKDNFQALIAHTAKTIWRSGNYEEKDLTLNKHEKEELVKIVENTMEFTSSLKGEIIEFKPKLKGYGFIPDLEADISIDGTLFEIKTVNRNFKSSDLKQLFIYLALKQVSEEENWKRAGLYNPRKGTYCSFDVKSMIYDLTGGKSTNEAFEDLLNSLVRDLEVDSTF